MRSTNSTGGDLRKPARSEGSLKRSHVKSRVVDGSVPHKRRSVRVLVLVVSLIALGEAASHFVFRQRAPSLRDWKRLKPRVASLSQPGDLVVVAPEWAEPLARQAFGDALMPLPMVARAGDDDFARAIEVGTLGQSRSELSGWTRIEHESFGKFEVSVRQNPAYVQSRYRFVDHVDSASLSVARRRGGIEEPCSFSESAPMTAGNLGGNPTSPKVRFNCVGGSWVGVTIIDDERYRPRRCIWAPARPGVPLVLRFRQVPIGSKLVGHAGGPWLMVRDGVGPPIELRASTAQGELGSVAAKDTDGWVRFEWSTTPRDKTEDVQLTVAATGSVEQRFCFTLEVR